MLLDPQLVERFGFHADQPSLFTAVVSLFLHQNVLHLLGNMVFLAAVGASVELATGSIRFAVVYFTGGLSGVLLDWVVMHRYPSPSPLIGASGAIAACVGYYAIRYRILRVPIGPKLSAPIYSLALVWLGLQLIGAVVKLGDPNPSVGYWAHIGGLLAGVVLCAAFRSPDIGQEKLDREVLDHLRTRSPAAAAMAAREHLKKYPGDMGAIEDLAEALTAMGDADELRGVLVMLAERCTPMRRAQVLKRVVETGGLAMVQPGRRLVWGRDLLSQDPELAFQVLQSIADEEPTPEQPEAYFRLAELFYDRKRAASLPWLERLRKEFPEHPATKRAMARGWIENTL